MVSDASKKKALQKKAAAEAKRGGKAAAAATMNGSSSSDNLSNGMGNLVISDRTCTGVLCSHPLSRDIRFIDVESGHTLHLVDRQPSELQVSSGSPNADTTAQSINAGQDTDVTGTHPRATHVSHSVVLGTLGAGDQNEAGNQDISQVIGAVLNSFGIAGQTPMGGITQPNMQFNIPVQVAQRNETGNQSQPRSPSQSMAQGFQTSLGSAPTIPTLDTPSNAHGLPSPVALAVVLRHAQHLISGHAVDSISHTTRRLEEEGTCTDVTVRTQIQTEAMQSGLAMQHLGALLKWSRKEHGYRC